MNYYAYVIYCLEHHRFWHGVSTDPVKAERAHNEGLIAETRSYKPWTLVHQEAFTTRRQAVRRLIFFRSRPGQNYLKKTLHY